MASSDEKRELVKIVCDGFSSLVFAFGYKTGIVKSFIEIEQPCTAEELSEKSGKKLRLDVLIFTKRGYNTCIFRNHEQLKVQLTILIASNFNII